MPMPHSPRSLALESHGRRRVADGIALFAALVWTGLLMPDAASAQAGAASTPGVDTTELAPATVTRIDSTVAALMAREHIPAVSIAIVRGNRIRLARGYGLADLENFIPATSETRFRIASLTKSLTATAVMQLVARGKLSLDDTIQRFVPEFPVKRYPVTIRHLLGHTSGIRHYAGNEYDNTRQYDSLAQTLELFKNDSLLHRPGETATYSTYGYVLLGLVIERASGMRYMEYLKRDVLDPARMADTQLDDQSAIVPHRARGYGKTAAGALRNALPTNTSYVLPAGGIIATASDLARFAIALQADQLLSPATRREMLSPDRLNNGTQIPLAFGFALNSLPGSPADLVWNGGNRQGATGVLYMRPGEQYAFVILTNLEDIGNPLLNASRDIAAMVVH
jgi:CubicO group peptidase (beta-lactamase class C family)